MLIEWSFCKFTCHRRLSSRDSTHTSKASFFSVFYVILTSRVHVSRCWFRSFLTFLCMIFQDHMNKQRSRAVATVIPYTNNATVTNPAKSTSPVLPHKPPLTLQESGIFEEEYEDDEESEVEFASRGTQTQAPSGELLQEVQRLQELRAWIQERAVKNTPPVFHPIDSSKICLDMSTVDSIVQLTAYQERVRDLEERLQVHEETEAIRVQEKRLSKQREEEFLDENYRLTERVYWLENELRNVRSSLDEIAVGSEAIVTKRSRRTEESKDEVLDETGSSEKTRDQFEGMSCTRAPQIAEMCVNNMIAECSRHQHPANAEDERNTSPMECNVTVCNINYDQWLQVMNNHRNRLLFLAKRTRHSFVCSTAGILGGKEKGRRAGTWWIRRTGRC